MDRLTPGSKQRTLVLLMALLVSALAGCQTKPTAPPHLDRAAAYRVGAPDRLRVSILPDPAIRESVTVRPDGMISVELIGDVRAGGRTTEEISADIQNRILRFKRDAVVTVSVESAQSETITIFGEVRSPGVHPLLHESRVAEVIGSRGGTTIFGWKSRIRLIRTDGISTQVTRVNLARIQAGDLTTNVQIEGGDILYVPPHPFAVVGYALQTLLFPFQQLMTATGGVMSAGRIF